MTSSNGIFDISISEDDTPKVIGPSTSKNRPKSSKLSLKSRKIVKVKEKSPELMEPVALTQDTDSVEGISNYDGNPF